MRYIANPRRAPRVPARLRVEVMHRGLDFRAETEDVGPKGCLVVSPKPLDPGAWVRLMLEAERLPDKLRVTGRVVWAVQPARDRAGVAFAEMQVDRNQDPFSWFERLMQASPGLVPLLRHVPDRLALDAPLYLLPPPRFIVDFTDAELRLVAGMRNGTTVDQLLQRIEPERKNEGRLIFALLSRRVLGLSPRDACEPSAWRPLLQQAGVVSGLDVGDEGEQVVRLSDLAVEGDAGASAAEQGREILPSWLTQTSPGWSERPGARVIVPPPPPELDSAPPAGPPPPAAARGAAAGRGAPSQRSPQAQQYFDHALAAAATGDLRGAVRLLREAQTFSPGDGEIARTLAELGYKIRGSRGN